MRQDLKQSRLQHYINQKTKPTHKNKEDTNQGGRYKNVRSKYSHLTQDESEVELEVYSHNYPKKVCPSFLLITPVDTIPFPIIVAKIKKIENSFQKQQIINLIAHNMKYLGCTNITNLQRIHDDDFWCLVMPKVMQIVVQQIASISCKIIMLTASSAQFIDLTRKQVFLILASMFLGIMPKQSMDSLLTFGKLMEIKKDESQQRIKMRLEKLKCIINYLKMMVANENLFKQKIRIERRHNFNTSYFQREENPMVKVDLANLNKVSIEDHYCEAIMTDFANKRIGGGVLASGCVQEEILFSIFPEAIVSKAICQQLEDNEAVVIYGAIRFSNYSGYSNQFEFKSSFEFKKFQMDKSVIVVIDALDFNDMVGKENTQFSKKNIRRQINKAFAGFNSLCLPQLEDMSICTGKWGCGVFKGDEDLKFIIQWIACSHAKRGMIYVTDSQLKLEEYRLMVVELMDFNTVEVINILDQYYKLRSRQKPGLEMGLMAYIKNFVI